MINDRITRINKLIKNGSVSEIVIQYIGRYDFLKCYRDNNVLFMTIIIETLSDISDTLLNGFAYPLASKPGNDLISPVYGSELLEYKNTVGYCDIETITIRINDGTIDPFYIDAINVDYILEHDNK